MCCGRQAPLGPLNQNAVKILNKTHCTQFTHTVSTLVYTVSVLSCLSACVLIKCRILLIKSNNAQRGSNAIKNASNSSAWAERHAKRERKRMEEGAHYSESCQGSVAAWADVAVAVAIAGCCCLLSSKGEGDGDFLSITNSFHMQSTTQKQQQQTIITKGTTTQQQQLRHPRSKRVLQIAVCVVATLRIINIHNLIYIRLKRNLHQKRRPTTATDCAQWRSRCNIEQGSKSQ